MGFGAVAGHLILLVALFSAGAIAAGAFNNSLSAQIQARGDFSDRQMAAANADYDLASDGYASTNDLTYANFTNEGAQEVPLDDITLLIDGVVVEHSDVRTFEVEGHASSNLWMPGETLRVTTENQGDVDVTISGPHGVSAHRRA